MTLWSGVLSSLVSRLSSLEMIFVCCRFHFGFAFVRLQFCLLIFFSAVLLLIVFCFFFLLSLSPVACFLSSSNCFFSFVSEKKSLLNVWTADKTDRPRVEVTLQKIPSPPNQHDATTFIASDRLSPSPSSHHIHGPSNPKMAQTIPSMIYDLDAAFAHPVLAFHSQQFNNPPQPHPHPYSHSHPHGQHRHGHTQRYHPLAAIHEDKGIIDLEQAKRDSVRVCASV